MPDRFARSSTRVSPDEFSQTMRQSAGAMLFERNEGRIKGGSVRGGLVELGEVDRLAVIGDLHGDAQTLFKILDGIGVDDFLSDSKNKLIFLGDYVDRGSDSVGVLYSVCALKGKYPHSVILMRGNHEAPAELPFSPHDLPYEMQDRFGSAAKDLYTEALSLFRLMTLAVVVGDRLLLVHGGLSTEVSDPSAISHAQEDHARSRVMEELLWNDPRPIEGWAASGRGIGRYFGADVTERWLRSAKAKVVVRGHEPCSGFKLDHGDRVFTLFSSKEAYPAFGAAYLTVDGDRLAKMKNGAHLVQHAIRL